MEGGGPISVHVPLHTHTNNASTGIPKQRTREKRLLAIIAVLVVSWIIVKIWADVFDVFMRKVLKVPKKNFLLNLIVAIVVTLLIVWALFAFDVDDLVAK